MTYSHNLDKIVDDVNDMETSLNKKEHLAMHI